MGQITQRGEVSAFLAQFVGEITERLGVAEQARANEVEQGPEIGQAVFYRGSGKGYATGRSQALHGFGLIAGRIFYGLFSKDGRRGSFNVEIKG